MKNYVCRAIQVSAMDQDQVNRLHEREKLCGFLLPNWNIQELFHLSRLRDKYNLPVESELITAHNGRIERELKEKGFLKTGNYLEGSLDWTHAFDKNVVSRAYEIIWDYAGPQNRRGGGLLKRLENTLGMFL